jgi:hypothetical protein
MNLPYRARIKAGSSTTTPREVLMNTAERFIWAKRAAFMNFRVSSVVGTWMLTMSERRRSSSSPADFTPQALASAGGVAMD